MYNIFLFLRILCDCNGMWIMRTCHGKDGHPHVGNNYVQENGLASSPEISYLNSFENIFSRQTQSCWYKVELYKPPEKLGINFLRLSAITEAFTWTIRLPLLMVAALKYIDVQKIDKLIFNGDILTPRIHDSSSCASKKNGLKHYATGNTLSTG